MTATIIDGRQVASKMQAEIAEQVAAFEQKNGYLPGLGVILVGEDPASQMYVRMKRRACKRAGIHSVAVDLPATATQDEVLQAVQQLNDDPKIHGILVQLPMPDQIDEETVPVGAPGPKAISGPLRSRCALIPPAAWDSDLSRIPPEPSGAPGSLRRPAGGRTDLHC